MGEKGCNFHNMGGLLRRGILGDSILCSNQAFKNYSFLYTGFRALKISLGARSCSWKIVHEKEQTCRLL